MKVRLMAWNHPDPVTTAKGNSSERRRRGRLLLGCVPVLVLLFVSVICWRQFRQPSQPDDSVKPLKEIAFSVSTVVKTVCLKEAVTNIAETVQEDVENPYAHKYPGEKILSVLTNANGFVQVESLAPNGRKTLHVMSKPSIFKHATDELILHVLNTPSGHEMPPLPNLGGKRADLEFRRSLKTSIDVLPEDTDQVKAYKEIVKSAREEILERMDRGEHFADILQDHRQMANENGKIRLNALRELRALQKSGDTAGAIAYASRVNGVFKNMGIVPIDLNETSNRRR